MNCINCGEEINGKFCAACGQRTDVKRITFKEGWFDFWARIYGFDGMFPRTLRDLTVRPGHVARKYIDGNRALYYGPVGYFFFMITIFLLFMSLINVDAQEYFAQRMVVPTGAGQQKMLQTILKFVSDNMKIIAFFIIPFNAITAHYFLFRKSGMNFLEHLVLPFFINGHLYWLNILSVAIYALSDSFFMNMVIGVITPFYFGYSYSALITNQTKTKAFLKGLVVPLISMVFMILVAIVIILLLAATIPEFYEFIRPSNNR